MGFVFPLPSLPPAATYPSPFLYCKSQNSPKGNQLCFDLKHFKHRSCNKLFPSITLIFLNYLIKKKKIEKDSDSNKTRKNIFSSVSVSHYSLLAQISYLFPSLSQSFVFLYLFSLRLLFLRTFSSFSHY